jgi:P27 family predicted phage terminase small subunit
MPFVARLSEVPDPPPALSDRAAAEWRELAPVTVWLGTLGSGDLRGFALLCETLATESEAHADVAARGFSIATTDGGLKGNPAVRVMETARAQAARLLEAFALTPRGRQAIDTVPLTAPAAPGGESQTEVLEDDAYGRVAHLRAVK